MWYILISWGAYQVQNFLLQQVSLVDHHTKGFKTFKTPHYKNVQSKHWNIWIPIFAYLYMCDVGNSALVFCMLVVGPFCSILR
jgi:hypothetical protein